MKRTSIWSCHFIASRPLRDRLQVSRRTSLRCLPTSANRVSRDFRVLKGKLTADAPAPLGLTATRQRLFVEAPGPTGRRVARVIRFTTGATPEPQRQRNTVLAELDSTPSLG